MYNRMIMGRILSIDYGDRRIGIAVSDEKKKMALPLKTLLTKNSLQDSAKELVSFIQSLDYPIELIVIGHPLLLNGTKSIMTKKVEEFSDYIEKTFPIHLIDERLSSAFTDLSLKDIGVNRKKRSRFSDEGAACVLLQNYIDQKNGT